MATHKTRAAAALAAAGCALLGVAAPSQAAATRASISAAALVQGDQLVLRVKSTQKTGYCTVTLAGDGSSSLGRVRLSRGTATKRVSTASLAPGSYYLSVRCGKQARVRSQAFTVELPPPVLPSETPAAELQPAKLCRLTDPSGNDFGFSFPTPTRYLPTTGTVRGVMLFVDFNDLPGKDDPKVVGPTFIDKFQQFYAANSYGKLQVKTDIFPQYIHVPFDSTKYGMDTWDQGDPWAYFQDAIAAADPLVDFSGYQFAIVMPPAEIKSIIYGPAFAGGRNNPSAQTAEGPLLTGAVGGADQRTASTGWIWLSHEFGHDLGMQHQYGPRADNPIWDLMDNVYIDKAPELFGWNRWRMGWIDDQQVRCTLATDAAVKPTIHRLTPVESSTAGNKLLLIRIDQSHGIAVESRHNIGFDHLLPGQEGALVYLVDVTRESNQFAFSVVPAPTHQSYLGKPVEVVRAGESVTVAGIRINVLASDASGELVSIGAAS